MALHYNRLAGQSVERLAALSDGVFAVARTLLVLDLHAPASEAIRTETDLLHALAPLAPRLLVYFMSFMTLGIFWVGQQVQLSHLDRSTRDLTWTHLAFLVAVTLMPFSTGLMAEFIRFRVALMLYWGNILLLGALLFLSWRCAIGSKVLKPNLPADVAPAVQRRIVVAQGLYAVGAALCVFDTAWSLGFIVLVQLNYVLAPRVGILSRL
jgi:uncharacterized membrane protein